MATRKTEQRLPPGVTPSDLGEAQGDAAAALISFHSSPVVVGRQQTYLVFVLDAGLQGSVESYRWTIGNDTIDTDEGVLEFTPSEEGNLQVNVSLRDSGDAELKALALPQAVGPLNAELETMMEQPDEVSPVAADPETSRELVNDVRGYIDELAPRSADPNSSMNRLIFAIAYAEALHLPPAERGIQLQNLAAALDEGAAPSFVDQAEQGIGLCQVRPHILGMYLNPGGGSSPFLTPRELPHERSERRSTITDLKNELGQLDPDQQADLFNLLRFPKSNLKMAIKLVEALMAQYFAAEGLPDILSDPDKAKTLIAQYKEGPFALA